MHRGDKNDCSFLKARVLANHLRQFKAIKLRHADIHQHDGDIVLQQMLQRLAPGSGLDQILAQFPEYDLVAEQLRRLIVHHEDVDLSLCRLRAPYACLSRSGLLLNRV